MTVNKKLSCRLVTGALMLVCIRPAGADTEHFSHVTVTPPSGWTRTLAGEWLQFTPANVPQGQTVAIQVSPGGPSNRDLAEEFAALIKASANGMSILQQNPPKSSTDRQGLKAISESVVFQDTNGKKQLRYFVARRSGGRFEAVVYTASTPDLASQFASAMNAFVAGMVFDGAPNPQPSPNTVHQTPNTERQIPNTQRPTPAPPVRFPPTTAKPMWITGRAVFENGQPIPKFHVQAGGFSGKFDPFLNNNLRGPQQLRETGSAFGRTEGANGQYAIHMTEDAVMRNVYALVQLRFDNTNYGLWAWPTDNISDGTSPATNDDYKAYTTKGIVRDFVLKMSGIKPGYDPAKCPDHEGNVPSPKSTFAYYGGTVFFSCLDDSTAVAHGGITKVYQKGSIVTVTFTPTGLRADGLPASTIKRTSPMDVNFSIYGIPYALYTASAQLAEPGGAVHNLKILSTMPPPHYFHPLTNEATTPSVVAEWKTSAPIRWHPMQDGTNSVIIPVTLYLGEE